MNIAYVEYDFPAPKGIGPWSAVEDKDGMLWIPYYGRGNEVVRLDPETAELTAFPLPIAKGGRHSFGEFPAPTATSGSPSWRSAGSGSLIPTTGKITEFQNTPLPDGRKTTAHTVRMDDSGRVWASGGPAISMLDPKTNEFKHFDVAGTYGIVVGQNGDVWFTVLQA